MLAVFGTRPEAIKLVPVIAALRQCPDVLVRCCATAQHRNMLDQVLRLAGIMPEHDLDVMRDDQPLDQLIARLTTRIGKVLDTERPARVIVQGDTASAMVAALAARQRGIAVAHVEAGLRSGSLFNPWPEEANRRMITALADLHFAPTPGAAAALVDEGIDPARVHVTGNTVIDALIATRNRLREDPGLAPRAAALLAGFSGRRIIVATIHRRESLGEPMAAIAAALVEIARRPDVAIVLPLHPHPRVSAIFRYALDGIANVALVEPLDYADFIALLDGAALVLTDSGGVQEEAPTLGTPVLVLRETTERPEGIAAGGARLVGVDRDGIVTETLRLLDDPVTYAGMARARNIYGDGNSGARIAALIAAAL